MGEQIPGDAQIEDPKAWTEQEQEEQLARYIAAHPDVENPFRESIPEVVELEALFDSFEATHPIAELFEISDLRLEDAPNHITREPARVALVPIVALLNTLQTETNISSDRFAELKARYKHISQAVGMINNNKVDHTR